MGPYPMDVEKAQDWNALVLVVHYGPRHGYRATIPWRDRTDGDVARAVESTYRTALSEAAR